VKFLLPLFALSALAFAQAPSPSLPGASPSATPSAGIWRCVLPGGTYEVNVRSIISVSSHEYIVDAGARVTEVNLDTAGALVARFYFLEPLTPAPSAGGPASFGSATAAKAQSLLTEATTKTGMDAWQKVVKNYPTTTHAHTVEYRLNTKADLTNLFNSLETAFRTGRAGAFQAQ
jgi:hypothetical protein